MAGQSITGESRIVFQGFFLGGGPCLGSIQHRTQTWHLKMTHFCPCDRVCILNFDFLPSNTFASGQYLTCLKIEGLKCSQVVKILQNIGIWSRHTVSVAEIKKIRPMMPSRWVNFVEHLIFDLRYLKYPNHLICSFILTLSMERPMWHSTKRSLGFVSLEEALCKPFTCHTT